MKQLKRKMKDFLFKSCLTTTVVWILIALFRVNGQTTLENENLRVDIASDGALRFTDKKNKESWGSAYVGWVSLYSDEGEEKISLDKSTLTIGRSPDKLELNFKGIKGEQINDDSFEMVITVALSDEYFDLEIEKLGSAFKLDKIEYPAHLFSVLSGSEEGYVVVPNLQGILIPSRYDAGFMRYGHNIWNTIADRHHVWSFESGSINMPWFGANKNGSSVFAYMMTSSDAYLRVIGNAVINEQGLVTDVDRSDPHGTRLSSLTPQWLSSKENLSYSRKLRVQPVSNGYVGMAKKYLEYARASGRYVTLREKIARNPAYEKIIGAPDIKIYIYTNRKNNPYFRAWSHPVLNGYSRVHTTFDQVAQMSGELRELGVKKCLILLGGWNRMGYDREHVDMWPPAEEAGGVAALSKTAEVVKSYGYLFALHDNYNDFYPDAPSYDERYIVRNRDGNIALGGVWDGGVSRHICTSAIEPLLNRNLDSIQNNIPLNAYYFDVITNTSHDECYAPAHAMTRKGDLQNRNKLIKNITNRGLVIGGERGTDWSMPVAAFYEGMQGGGTGYHRGIAYRMGLAIPLFYLVYHDCVIGYWQHGTPAGREDHANHMLLDLLYAQPSSWSVIYNQWEDLKPLIKDAYDLLSDLNTRTAHHPMTNHEVLSDDFMVQKSEFGDGTEVYVNFGIRTYDIDDMKIGPKGFVIKNPDQPLCAGSVGRRVFYND